MTDNTDTFLLVVDDDPALREVLQEILRYAGYQVRVAASADQARHLLRTADTPPQLIISDLLMPDMDGYQFLLAVRADETGQPIPFLFISGQEATLLLEEPSLTGIVGYLSKPFAVDDLLTIVAGVVGHNPG